MSTYTHPDGRAFSLRIIGAPFVTRTIATSESRICAPRSVSTGRLRRFSSESRISRG